MADRPIQYAPSDAGHVAYQVVGDQEPVLVLLYTLTASFESLWDLPAAARTIERLAEHCRVVLVDRRGTGGSDPLQPDEAPDAVGHAADVAAVLVHAGVRDVVVVGESYMGGPAALTLAANHPERVREVVVVSTPVAADTGDLEVEASIDQVIWGEADDLAHLTTPTGLLDPAFGVWSNRAGRSTSPSVARAMWQAMLAFDLSPILRDVVVPVTVVSTGHWTASPASARELAERLPQARVVDVPRDDTLLFLGDNDALVDEILLVATGARHRGRASRRLLAILFTDISDSTVRAASVGDVEWRRLLDEHDRLAATIVRDNDGAIVKSMGDGMLATFDLPSSAMRAADDFLRALERLGFVGRAGVHVGEVEVRGDDIGGLAVHVAARVADVAAPGEVLATAAAATTTLGSVHVFDAAGRHELRGIADTWEVLRLRRRHG